jgi:hypothetical protein
MTMPSRPLLLAALGATLTMSAATAPAIAADCFAPCVRHVVVVEPAEPLYVKPFFIVDHGPVYGGPGIVTRPLIKEFHVRPAKYPYVTHIYSYSSYHSPMRRQSRAYK